MSASKRTHHEILKKRKHKLEAALLALPVDQPRAGNTRTVLEKEIELVKAELRAVKSGTGNQIPVKKAMGKPTHLAPVRSGKGKKNTSKQATTKRRSKKPPLPGGASFPSFQLPSPKSPTFVEDSLKTVGNLRALCRQGLGYLQRADQLFDSLHGVGSHLHEQGILPKILQGKMKELNTADWTAILIALMNSPLSGMLLGSPSGGGDSSNTTPAEPQAQTASATKEQDGQS